MSRIRWMLAGFVLALLGSAALFTQSPDANAAVSLAVNGDQAPQATAASLAEPVRVISRRERMARIVAEQAAISAEAAARKTLAERAAEASPAPR